MKSVRILLWLPLVAFLIVLGLVSSGLIKPQLRSTIFFCPLKNGTSLHEGTSG